jgi:beta-galactosidase/beta-glucuronidase
MRRRRAERRHDDSRYRSESAENWIDLTGTWEFAFDDADKGLQEAWFDPDHKLGKRITVPFPPESRLSGIGDTGFHRVFWYRRSFEDPRTESNEHVLLRFGAVDYRATIWVDGQFVGSHEGGHTPFSLDISHAMSGKRKKKHHITVRVEDDPYDVEQPRGKQDWQETPHRIWYHRTSGIWQPVWLEIVPQIRLENIRWTFDPARWTVSFDAELSGCATPGSIISIALEDDDGPFSSVTQSISDRTVSGTLDVRAGRRGEMNPGNILWSPKQPNLLGVRLTLSSPGHADDQVLTYVGLRTVTLTQRRLLINGTPTFMRFVLEQGYWPESQLTAPSPDALRKEVELIKDLGFNGARIHQKIEDPRFLFWADRLGLLLWGEIANAFRYSDLAIDRHAREWREAVVRDRNHPSVIAWVPFNESWGVNELGQSPAQQHAVRAAYHATHQLDGSRPVIGNDGWENTEGDLFTLHDYSWDPAVLDRRYGSGADVDDLLSTYFPGQRRATVEGFDHAGKPMMVTEFGGVSYAPKSGEKWFGYGTVNSGDEYLEKYRALVGALSHSELICGFCYTQLTDTEQETNGLLTEDRKPKVDIEEIRRITSGEH